MVIFTPDKRHVDMEQSFDLSPELAKQARYEAFLPRLAALIEGIDDEVAVLANTAAALREAFGFFWVGFYRAEGEELRLGPFQGTVACYRIRKGRGVLDIDSDRPAAFDETDRCWLERIAALISETIY